MPRRGDTDPLETYEIDLADRILVSSMDEDPIEPRLEDGQWFLQSGLSADASRLETLLELATLYLGTSRSFRLIHAREADSDNIFAIELARYDLPMRQDDWLDKPFLQTAGAVDSMERVRKWKAELDGEGTWRFVESSLGAKSDELFGMATRFETPRVMGISDEQPDRATDLEFDVAAGGETIRYGFYRPVEDEEAS